MKTPVVEAHFFAAARANFEQARDILGEERHGIVIAGRNVVFRFAGNGLVEPLLKAFAHLPHHQGLASLEVLIWDSQSSNIRPPARIWALESLGAKGEIPGFDGHVLGVHLLQERSLQLLHGHTAICWRNEAAGILAHESAAPFKSLLSWWAAQLGMVFTHAGAIGRGHGGLLLAGRSGSGKSTTALTALEAGFLYAGDDYCLLDPNGDWPVVHSVYSSGKIAHNHLENLPFLESLAFGNDHHGKAVTFTHEQYASRLSTGFTLNAIVLPRVTGGQTRLEPVSAQRALLALAPSSVFQLPNAGPVTLKRLAGIVQTLPCFELQLGPDLAEIPPILNQLLDSLEVA